MSRATATWFVVVLVLVSLSLPVMGQVDDPAVSVSAVSYSGDGNFDGPADELELWTDDSHEFSATVAGDDRFDGDACLVTETDQDERTTLACTAATVPANETATVGITVDEWPDGLNGSQSASVELRVDGDVAATSDSLRLTALAKDGDPDDDGLSNEREVAVGSDLRTPDSDGDGLGDGEEVHTYETDPTTADTDGDGLNDSAEVERYRTDPTATNTDGDGLPDQREVELGTNPNRADTDGDGLGDAVEVNTHETNATNPDTDGDGLGDGAEVNRYETNPTSADTDGDGLTDALEVNTYETDPVTADTDGDGLADGPEVNEYQTDPTAADTDDDGLVDGREVGTHGTSPTNADTDGDGLSDGAEVNRYGTDPTSADSDGDGINDRAEVHAWYHFPVPVVGLAALATVLTVAGSFLYRSDRTDTLDFSRIRSSPERDSVLSPESRPPSAHAENGGDAVPPEFLSNEERIQQLLAANDGRIRQAEIVERTDWSKSKVSRVLSGMAEDDEIVKVDVGKGNVITLPDRVPQGARSPFDE